MAARAAAKGANTLDELREILRKFDGCALKATATQLVFADGNPQARVMFVGEAPGRDEDIEGLPFVGRSGKLLDRMLAAIGLDRTSVYIANIVPWRPPGNRTPTPQESAICLPFILRQIELADPDILVCLGGPSAQTLLGIKEGITKTRGRWFTFDTGKREIRAMPTFHPAFLLRSPLQKRFAWRDFLGHQEGAYRLKANISWYFSLAISAWRSLPRLLSQHDEISQANSPCRCRHFLARRLSGEQRRLRPASRAGSRRQQARSRQIRKCQDWNGQDWNRQDWNG